MIVGGIAAEGSVAPLLTPGQLAGSRRSGKD